MKNFLLGKVDSLNKNFHLVVDKTKLFTVCVSTLISVTFSQVF